MRRLLLSASIYGGGDILAKASSLLTIPIFTRIFPPEEYGVLAFVQTVIGLLIVTLTLGFDSALARRWFENDESNRRKALFSTCFWFYFGWSVFVALPLAVLSDSIARLSFADSARADLWLYSVVSLPLFLLSNLCQQALRNQERAGLFITFNLLQATTTVGCSLAAVLLWNFGIEGLLLGALIGGITVAPLRVYSVRQLLIFSFEFRLLRKMLLFGIPLTISGFAYWAFSSIDRMLIGLLVDFEQLGLYGIAAALVGVLLLFHSAFGQAWWPIAVQMYEKDRSGAAIYFGQVATYMLAGFGFLAIAMSAFGAELLYLLAAPQFASAAKAIPPLVFGFVAYGTTQITHLGISLSNNTRYLAVISWLVACFNFVLNLALIPIFGMEGAAWANAASYTMLSLCYLVMGERLWHICWESRRSAAIIALIIGFVLLTPRLQEYALPVKVGYVAGYLALLFATRAFDKREWGMIERLLLSAADRRKVK